MGSDIRFALRSLRRSPLVTIVAVVCLALGIGANTTVYTVAEAFLIHPFPGLGEPERIVTLTEMPPDGDDWGGGVSPANFADWRREATASFAEIAGFDWWDVNVTGAGGEPERAAARLVTPNIFRAVGVPPLMGRGFSDEEAEPGRSNVVVLGYGFWRHRFAGDARAVGRTLILNGTPHTIVGVAARNMVYPEAAQLYVPLVLDSAMLANRIGRSLDVVGRLRPGVTVAQARAELTPVARRLAERYPEANRGWGTLVENLERHHARHARPYVAVLVGAVLFVLLIACGNVANLLLARAAARRREMAVRTALGAGRMRLVRALLAESLALAMLGGGAGALLALWGTRLVREALPAEEVQFIPSIDNISVDARALAFTIALSVLTSVVFGLAPAIAASRAEPQATLRQGGRGATAGGAGGAGGGRMRRALVVAEVALSLVLMVCTGLMVRSFGRMAATDPGFRRQNILTTEVVLPKTQYGDTAAVQAYFARLLQRVRALPGVRAAALANVLPLTERDRSQNITVEGRPPVSAEAERPWAGLRIVTPEYLTALSIPLHHGRGLLPSDAAGGPMVALINETMVRRHWPGEEPARVLGRRFTIAGESGPRTVVGVAADVLHRSVRDPAQPEMFVPLAQTLNRTMQVVLSTAPGVDPTRLGPALRGAVSEVDPSLAAGMVVTLERLSDNMLSPYRITATMLGVLAVIALLLAAAGVFGVLSYAVAQRTQEMGIRMALGARAADVMRLVVRQGMGPALLGVALGLAGAGAAGRALGGMLYGVGAGDPATFASVTLVTVLCAFVASWLPARRATRVDPMVALREE